MVIRSTPAGQKVLSNDTQSSTSTVAEVKVSCTSDSAVGSATTPHSHNTTQTHSHSSVSEGHKGHASGANGGGVLSNGCKNTDKCHCFLAGNTVRCRLSKCYSSRKSQFLHCEN